MTTPPPTLPNPPRDHSRVLLDTLAAHRGAFLQAGALSLGINLLMLTPTLYMLQVYDRVLISHNELTLLVMSVITLALFALMAIAEAWRSRLLVRISDAIEARLGEPVFLACFASSLNAISRRAAPWAISPRFASFSPGRPYSPSSTPHGRLSILACCTCSTRRWAFAPYCLPLPRPYWPCGATTAAWFPQRPPTAPSRPNPHCFKVQTATPKSSKAWA